MRTYLIRWSIEVDADSPREAAQKALAIQRDPKSGAVAFDVYGEEAAEVAIVDLLEDDLEDVHD